jgi:DNA-binding NarL/FixJ family response regulator
MTDRMLNQAISHTEEPPASPYERLSDREMEVFEMIGNGLGTKQIAAKLELSRKTVETYREHIKSKLNLANGTELTRHAVQWVLERG